MRKEMIGAITYPAMLMLSVGGAFYLIATKVMPRLLLSVKPENMDASVHLLSGLSTFVAENGSLMLAFIIALSFGMQS